jgi:hypothetical protein
VQAAGNLPNGENGPRTGPKANRLRVCAPVRSRGVRTAGEVNAPKWTKWGSKQVEISVGDIRQWSNETVVSAVDTALSLFTLMTHMPEELCVFRRHDLVWRYHRRYLRRGIEEEKQVSVRPSALRRKDQLLIRYFPYLK